MKSIYESTGKGYTQQGDYLLPNLQVNEEPEYNIGILGQSYRQHLNTYRKPLHQSHQQQKNLLLTLQFLKKKRKKIFHLLQLLYHKL